MQVTYTKVNSLLSTKKNETAAGTTTAVLTAVPDLVPDLPVINVVVQDQEAEPLTLPSPITICKSCVLKNEGNADWKGKL